MRFCATLCAGLAPNGRAGSRDWPTSTRAIKKKFRSTGNSCSSIAEAEFRFSQVENLPERGLRKLLASLLHLRTYAHMRDCGYVQTRDCRSHEGIRQTRSLH